MADILLEPLPTEWEGRAIDPDFRPMVWLSNQYQRKREKKDTLAFAQEAFRRFYREPIPPQRPRRPMKVYCAFTTGPTRPDVPAEKAAVPVSLPWILPVTRTI